MVTSWSSRLRSLRRWFSRSEWVVRLLRLPRERGKATEPGLLMIQIDGLSRSELERAIQRGRMPFLRKLMQREGYQLHDFYSGLPSTTPAVQGELFYGIKCAVPSFGYRDHETGQMVRMFHPEPARKVQARLEQTSTGLLQDGSAYCDIYSGGAAESNYCAVDAGLSALLKAVNPFKLFWISLWHIGTAIRVIFLVFLELIIAFADVIHGTLRGREFLKECKFIISRVTVSILLREMGTYGVMVDVARGLSIVHINLLGYDEQAHQRGPSSKFAHWVLKGVDRSIKQMWSAARRSAARDYEVWIYSDHGQERCRSYWDDHQESIQEAVGKVLAKEASLTTEIQIVEGNGREGRSHWLGKSRFSKLLPSDEPTPPPSRAAIPEADAHDEVMVVAMGPIGHIYIPQRLDPDCLRRVALGLVQQAHVPMVLYGVEHSTDPSTEEGPEHSAVSVVTSKGEFQLPKDADRLFPHHPFQSEMADDLMRICRHPDSGTFVICGYNNGDQPITFAGEVGAHGGPGPRETNAFALLTSDAPLPATGKSYLRASDLRRAALHYLERERLTETTWSTRVRKAGQRVRVMTYNVHACIGMDDELSLGRIARVIEQSDADVIALQELDVRRNRTGGIDQVQLLARILQMDHVFYPAIREAHEMYGDAILSRFPLRTIKADRLPGLKSRPDLEPRGAVWCEVDLDGQTIQIVNSHFGLNRFEQLEQAKAIFSDQWIGDLDPTVPLVVCGDFNARPKSVAYEYMRKRMRDVQHAVAGHKPRATWLSGTPFNRIDHIFVSPSLRVEKVEVRNTTLTRVASDHLPLVADILLPTSEPDKAPAASVKGEHERIEPDRERSFFESPTALESAVSIATVVPEDRPGTVGN